MCEPSTIALVASLAVGAISAKASYDQGQTQKAIGRNNQIMAEQAAKAAEAKGERDAIAVRRKGDQVLGAQRAAQAASGLDLSVGTAKELQDQTSFFNAQDIATTRNNARQDAWAMRAQGANYRASGDAAARQGSMQAAGTLLSTGSQVAGKWYDMNPRPNAALSVAG